MGMIIVPTFVLKHLRDLWSGKPETDLYFFATEAAARAFVASDFPRFVPWDEFEEDEEDEEDSADLSPTQWTVDDGDEYLELEPVPLLPEGA